MSFVKIGEFQKGGAMRNNINVQYVENNVFFLTLNRINTLHYTKYTTLLFLAISYDPFKFIQSDKRHLKSFLQNS